MPSIRRSASHSSTDSDVRRDPRIASDEHLSFFQENILVTGRLVPADRRTRQGPYLFETSTRSSVMEIATTETIPPCMIKRDRPGPIHRPAADNTPFERRRTVRTYFPHERRGNATAARFRYATPIPSQVRLPRVPCEVIVIDDSDDEEIDSDDEVIFVENSDDEAYIPRDVAPAGMGLLPPQAAAVEDGRDEDEDEAAVNAALADLDAAVDEALANFDEDIANGAAYNAF